MNEALEALSQAVDEEMSSAQKLEQQNAISGIDNRRGISFS